jgi:hypothetical protein
MSSNSASQVIFAPSQEPSRGLHSIFLAGTTSKVDTSDWREVLSTSLATYPLTIYNPYRPDWDSTWREDIDFLPFREQVQWELDKQAKADVVVVYFHPETQAPISLLELGLSAPIPGKVIVVCPSGFWKRGNVQIVCERFGIGILDSIDELQMWIVKKFDWHHNANR